MPVQTVCGRTWQVGYVVKPRLVPRYRPAGSSYQSHTCMVTAPWTIKGPGGKPFLGGETACGLIR
ncbi:hypothetical protein GCM10022255_113580 [Dactylosporangium darangshiense]|uniref:Uncharacterized protein n=1 Tax=Dactylosporangium darangshiense TaxID=579108 RepID=A0ABP8DVF8_9ACTN